MKYPNHLILDMVKTTTLNSPYSYKYKSSWVDTQPNFLALITKKHNVPSTFTLCGKPHKIIDLNSVYAPVVYFSVDKSNKKWKYNKFILSPSLTYSYPSTASRFDENFGRKNLLTTLNQSPISFIRKEKIYTKLKYSWCPQYDMVSGGIAALFSAFLGFLICEKFGLELLDSGDFYIAFMYGVFISFSLRPFLRILSLENPSFSIFSLKILLTFLLDVFVLILKTFNYFLKTKTPRS